MTIDKICILHQTGICLFSHEFSGKISMNLEMLSSFVMALISFSQETAESEIKSTKMGDKHIYINAQGDLIVILVSIGSINQKQVNKLLESIKIRFNKNYQNFLKGKTNSPKYYNQTSEMIFSYFKRKYLIPRSTSRSDWRFFEKESIRVSNLLEKNEK